MQTPWRQGLIGAVSPPGPFGGLLKRSAGQNGTEMAAEISRRMDITFRLHLTGHGLRHSSDAVIIRYVSHQQSRCRINPDRHATHAKKRDGYGVSVSRAPYPPPPGVAIVSRSPASTCMLNFDGRLRRRLCRINVFFPGLPGSPPSKP